MPDGMPMQQRQQPESALQIWRWKLILKRIQTPGISANQCFCWQRASFFVVLREFPVHIVRVSFRRFPECFGAATWNLGAARKGAPVWSRAGSRRPELCPRVNAPAARLSEQRAETPLFRVYSRFAAASSFAFSFRAQLAVSSRLSNRSRAGTRRRRRSSSMLLFLRNDCR